MIVPRDVRSPGLLDLTRLKMRHTLLERSAVNLRVFDWIWHVRGSLALAPGQSSDEAFDKLDPLFQQPGTSRKRTHDTLTFSKKDQAAQDKMSVFDGGTLRVERGVAGPVLHYRLASRALLFCFLVPLLFLAFAQLTIFLGSIEKPPVEKADKAKKDVKPPENWIDKALGAPTPEKPKKDDKDKSKDKKHSPTSAYVFAGIFATLYAVGRVLEDRLIKGLFKKGLAA